VATAESNAITLAIRATVNRLMVLVEGNWEGPGIERVWPM